MHNINKHFKQLERTQIIGIQKIDALLSFANDISTRFETQARIINENFGKTQKHLEMLENAMELQALLLGEIYESETFLDTLSRIETTISMSFNKIPNLDMINVSELYAVHDYLLRIYNPSQLLPFDEIHLYKILEGTKLIAVGTKNSIIFLLKTPILNPYPASYYRVYPLPTSEDTVLAPPQDRLVKTENLQLWTNEECSETNSVALCEKAPIPDKCHIPATSQCDFVKFTNDYAITIPLSNQQLLVSFRKGQEIIENCNGLLTRQTIKGTHLLSSICTLIIGPRTFSNTTAKFEIPLPAVESLPSIPVEKSIDYTPQLLEEPKLILKEAHLLPTLPWSDHDPAQWTVMGLILLAMLMTLTLVLAYHRRITSLFCHPRTIIHLEAQPCEDAQST